MKCVVKEYDLLLEALGNEIRAYTSSGTVLKKTTT